MNLVNIIVVLIVFGLIWWLIQTYILPRVAEPFRTIIIILVVVLVILWLLSLVGYVGPIGPLHFNR